MEKTPVQAVLAYIPFVCLFAVKMGTKGDQLTEHHLQQGVMLFVVEMAAVLVFLAAKLIFRYVNVLEFVLCDLPAAAALLLFALLSLVGIASALFRTHWQMPLIGMYAKRLDL